MRRPRVWTCGTWRSPGIEELHPFSRAARTRRTHASPPTVACAAYASSGEVYLTRFPTGEGKWPVSVDGGWWPHWDRSGRLFYAREDDIIEVEVTLGPVVRMSKPMKLFTRKSLGRSMPWGGPPGFDVTADGQRFVIALPVEDGDAKRGITVVQNWFAEFAAPARPR